MTHITVRPLAKWPYPTEQPRESRFRTHGSFSPGGYVPGRPIPYGQTEQLLERELDMLGVTEAVLQLDLEERNLRQDGGIRSDARLKSSRVILSFKHPKQGAVSLPCAAFTTWQDNVRAIALSLEALRKVDRFGVTQNAEQYAGWRALPSTTGVTMTTTRAAEIVAGGDDPDLVRRVLHDEEIAKACIRAAVKRTHPDAGGSAEQFNVVQTARKIIETHHAAAVAR